MHLRLLLALVCTISLFVPAPAAGSAARDTSRQAQAAWLSQQLDYPVQASQVLFAPEAATLEGCTIARARRAPTGATALSLRCAASALPHLVLLDLPRAAALPLLAPRKASSNSNARPAPGATAAKPPNIVRAGTALRADWRTGFIHAQLPVIALDSGAAGAEIRVRIAQTNRVVRARVISANSVAIIVAGA